MSHAFFGDSKVTHAIVAVMGIGLVLLGASLLLWTLEAHYSGSGICCGYTLWFEINHLYLILGLVTLGSGIVLLVLSQKHKMGWH